MEDLNNKTFAYLSLIIGAVASIVGFLSGNPLFGIVAAFFVFAGAVFWKVGYLFVPALTKRMRIVEFRDNYEIPPGQDVIVKRSGGKYHASSFMQVLVYDSVTEKSEEDKALLVEYFERAISNMRNVIKLGIITSVVDVSKYTNELKGKRSELETQKARIANSEGSANEADMVRLEREITAINRQLDRLTKGERPMEVISYAMTTASSHSKEDAIAKVKNQAKEMSSIISNSLNVEVLPLVGEDMKKCFEWEYAIPSTRGEVEDAVF